MRHARPGRGLLATASTAVLLLGASSFDPAYASAAFAQTVPTRTLTTAEQEVLEDAHALVEAQEEAHGVVEQLNGAEPEAPTAAPAQIPSQLSPLP